MKFRTKIVIFLAAAVISLVAFEFIVSGLTVDRLLQVARPVVETSFTMTQILS
ncbi:MAG: hypothetical protein PHU81_07850 [Acidobacteriota bacterium]|nr:hypothetical protein [Acidobacteriota bacterium]